MLSIPIKQKKICQIYIISFFEKAIQKKKKLLGIFFSNNAFLENNLHI